MKIQTKYNIGDEVYIIRESGLGTTYFKPVVEKIKNILIGGKIWEKYQFNNTSRAEKDIFTDIEKAKLEARKMAKEHYEKNLMIIKEKKYPALKIK